MARSPPPLDEKNMQPDDSKGIAKKGFAKASLEDESKLLTEAGDWAAFRKIETIADRARHEVAEEAKRSREADIAKELVKRIDLSKETKDDVPPVERLQKMRDEAAAFVERVKELKLSEIDIEEAKTKLALYERLIDAHEERSRAKIKTDFKESSKDQRER